MKPRPYTLLLHPVFLVSLALLLANDFYFKYEFHNGFTGKLSDFAGLFVFAVFMAVLFPGYKKPVIVFCGLFFCWWKSPLSDFLVTFATGHLSLPLHRVVDYTDLAALFVLPLAYRIKPSYYPITFIRSFGIYTIGIISLFSFCSTSMPRYIQGGEVELDKSFRTQLHQEEIIGRFDEKNIPIDRDTAYYEKLSGNDKYLIIKDSSGKQKTIRIADYKEIELYERTVPYTPTYTISALVIKDDTIRNIRFSISEMYNRKKRVIRLKSFEQDTSRSQGYYRSQMWLKRKFEKPIMQKIEEILK